MDFTSANMGLCCPPKDNMRIAILQKKTIQLLHIHHLRFSTGTGGSDIRVALMCRFISSKINSAVDAEKCRMRNLNYPRCINVGGSFPLFLTQMDADELLGWDEQRATTFIMVQGSAEGLQH